jgi:hypothetical protein
MPLMPRSLFAIIVVVEGVLSHEFFLVPMAAYDTIRALEGRQFDLVGSVSDLFRTYR